MEKHMEEIGNMLKKADKLYDKGDITQARLCYQGIIKLASEGKHYDLAVDACMRLGPIYSRQNDYRNMLNSYENALLMTRMYKLKSKEPKVYKKLGDGYWRIGAFGMARNYYGKCEETLCTIKDEVERKVLAASLYANGYGNLFNDEGRYGEAIGCYRKSLRILREIEQVPSAERVGLTLLYTKYNMGVAYERLGNSQERAGRPSRQWFKKALRLLEEVRSSSEKGSYEYAVSTLDAGFCYAKIGVVDKAEKYTEEAMSLLSQPRMKARDLMAWGHMNRGIIAMKRRLPGKAVEYFKKAIKMYEEIGISEWVAMVYSELGSAYKLMGDSERSTEAFKRSQEFIELEKSLSEIPIDEANGNSRV